MPDEIDGTPECQVCIPPDVGEFMVQWWASMTGRVIKAEDIKFLVETVLEIERTRKVDAGDAEK